MSRTRPGDTCKLRVAFGDVPQPGTELRTPTGRRYMVLKVGGKATLHCYVMGADDPPGLAVWTWTWSPRKKKARVLR
ncbi:hypothetical protein D9M73_70690 [compost metagenome]|nr:MAG TPA: hypothetical protein [Caudoviricetes sp.]